LADGKDPFVVVVPAVEETEALVRAPAGNTDERPDGTADEAALRGGLGGGWGV
jgi:hypothetical protein